MAAAGAKLYKQHCQSCHGANLQGGLEVAGATSANIRWSELKKSYTATTLVRAIMQGKDETDSPLDAAMPRWHGTLTTGQVNEIIAYLKTK